MPIPLIRRARPAAGAFVPVLAWFALLLVVPTVAAALPASAALHPRVAGSFTIYVDATAGGHVSPGGDITVAAGANQTLTITVDPCYHVQQVFVDGAPVGPVTSYTFTDVQDDHSFELYAGFDLPVITATAGSGGSITPVGTLETECGGSRTFTITPNLGEHNAGVTVDGVAVGAVASYTFTNVMAAHTIAASFAVNATTTTVTTSPNPSVCGQLVTLTATVTPNPGTGSVKFFVNGTLLTIGVVVGGVARVATPALPGGTDAVVATFTGAGGYLASTSASYTHTVNANGVSLALTASPAPSLCGQAVVLRATTTPVSGGTVTFSEGATTLGTSGLGGGVATLTIHPLTGSHTYAALFSQSGCVNGANATVTQEVDAPPATTIGLSTPVNPSLCGQPIPLTATVGPSGATGTVTFKENGATQTTVNVGANGTAAWTFTTIPGSHSYTATYSGDGCHPGATSAPYVQTVNPTSTSTTALTASPNPSGCGQSVILTANVTPSTANGTLIFKDGTTTLVSLNLVNGAATYTYVPAVGTHSFTANYQGESCTTASTSPTVVQTVHTNTVTVNLVSTPNPSGCDQSVSLTATVSPGSATGTVTFLDGATTLASRPLAGGTAVISLIPTTGTHHFTARYGGDACDIATTSADLVHTVNPGGPLPGITLASSLNPSPFGQLVTLTATVTPSYATGAVQFFDGAASLGTATINGGHASLGVTLTTGTHSVTATYGGDGCYTSQTSAPLSQVVTPRASVVSIGSSPNPSSCGATVTLSAFVSPADATGTVTFLDGATSLGSGGLSAGRAAITTSFPTPIIHTLTAHYSGDAQTFPATSQPLSHAVSTSPTSILVAPSENPISFGQPLTLQATVSPATLRGTVTFFDSSTVLGTAPIVDPGVATLTVNGLRYGYHYQLGASWPGDGGACLAPCSYTYTQIVRISPTVSVTSSVNPAGPGQLIRLKATLSPPGGTGDLYFYDGDTFLGLRTPSPTGQATLFTASLSPGTHPIQVQYGGDAASSPASSPIYNEVVTGEPSSVALVTDPNPVAVGATLTWTATVTPSDATGTIEFLDDGIMVGTQPLLAGAATFQSNSLTPGYHDLTAYYDGTDVLAPSESPAVEQVVGNFVRSGGPLAAHGAALPVAFALTGAWPNPTSGALTVEYAVPNRANVRLSIVDVAGREVAALARGASDPGYHRAGWNARSGGGVTPGLYFLRLETPGRTFVQRIAVTR